MIEMQDHVAVITGAGSGFGEATALRLAREGMPIFCQDINEENAQRTAAKVREGNGRAEAHRRRCLQRGRREGHVRGLPQFLRRLHAALRQCRLRPALPVRRDERRGLRPHGGGAAARRLPLRSRSARPDAGEGRGRHHQHRLAAWLQGGHRDGPLCRGEGRGRRAHQVAGAGSLEPRRARPMPSRRAPATRRSSTTSRTNGKREKLRNCPSAASARRGRSPRPWLSSQAPAAPSTSARPLGPTRATSCCERRVAAIASARRP